jgi:site-specific DNA recombinase
VLSATTNSSHRQRTVNRLGTEYFYFFCRNRQEGICDAPHIGIVHIEEAVEQHYAHVRFSAGFIADVRAHLKEAIGNEGASAQLLHQQLTTELRALDGREENLIDLAADGALPQAKIKAKLHDIERQRQHLSARLTETNDDLSDAARLIEACLTLLANPQELYRRCDDDQRRLLNQAIFHALYIEDDQITDHDLSEPFAQLHAVQDAWNAASLPDSRQAETQPQNATSALPPKGKSAGGLLTIEDLLGGAYSAPCSSKPSMVGDTGIEPVTPSV